jgi:glycine dehydrogenase subunit 1
VPPIGTACCIRTCGGGPCATTLHAAVIRDITTSFRSMTCLAQTLDPHSIKGIANFGPHFHFLARSTIEVPMRYLPKSPADRTAMLADIGAASIDDLFSTIPAEYQLKRDLNVPRQHSEHEVVEVFRRYAEQNATGYASFLGAGAYKHYRPVIIDSLSQRGEFLTSYTPYQPEIAQGTLQALFEFQTMICDLTGMEIANASMYDGSTGAAEAVMMAVRVTGRNAAVIARTVHPEYREVLSTYAQHQGIPISEVEYARESGRVDLAALDAAITDDTACVLIQSPNFFGTIEDVAAIAEIAHKKGALLIVSIAEALSLGVVAPPVEADIVSLEAQSFGVPVGFGGPYCGVIAAKEKFLRQMPGRLCGQTVDTEGRRGFVLTLSTREQHIRREKATSNICTNQSLVALMVTIFLTVYGKEGVRELAEQNLAKAHYAAETLGAMGKLLFNTAPRFNEFVLETSQSVDSINTALLAKKIIGGLPLAKWYPELGLNAALWCATELNTKVQIDAASAELK